MDSRYVERFEIQASEQTRQLFMANEHTETGSLQFGAAVNNEGLPLPVTLTVTSGTGETLHSIGITLTKRTVGRRGIRLIGSDASGVMTVTHTIQHTDSHGPQPGTFHFGFEEVIGQYPYAVRPAMDFILAMNPGNRLSVHMGHTRMGFADITDDSLNGARPIARLVVALDELQRQPDDLFPVPAGLTYGDVAEFEIARDIIAGRQAQWLGNVISMQIPADRFQDFLASDGVADEPGPMVLREDALSFTCGDRTFNLGAVELWGPKMRLANRSDLDAAAAAGTEAAARWECTDGERLYIRRIEPPEVGT